MKLHRLLTAGILAASLSLPANAAHIPVDDLLAKVDALATGGNPASMITWGDARPLVVSPDGDIFAAAATLARGRLVVLGHGGFVQTADADSEVFAVNALPWLSARRSSSRNTIRIFGLTDAIEAECAQREVNIQRIGGTADDVRFEDVDVVIGSPQAFSRAGRIDELERWIRRGGGMIVTETAWGQLQLNPGLTIDALPANHLLSEAGVRFTSGAHSGFGPGGTYPVDRDRLLLANADHALDILAGKGEGESNIELAARIVGNAFGAVPLDSTLIRRADRLAAQHRQDLDAVYRNLAADRLTPSTHALGRALIDLDARRAMELPPTHLRAHPSSVAFPGEPGPARERLVSLDIDPGVPGWHSTGLYAAAGEVVRVRTSEAAAKRGDIVIQIGAWQDQHQHPWRVRLRSAMRRYTVTEPVTLVASAIGGPIYVDIPVGYEPAEPLSIEFMNVVRAPLYHHGVTDPHEWRRTIRQYPAPWAEIGSDELFFTVPSEVIRDLEYPELVMDHWNRVHEAMESLEPRTANHWSDRPYRYVADTSVSYGYMYCPSDAPIVIPTSEAGAIFDLANFDAKGPNKLWGHYHEMGHAHQNQLWTDHATGEVTVNIFTVYALHTVNGYPLDSDVMRSHPPEAWKIYSRQKDFGDPFDKVGGPFETLQFYALLWHHFGFETFHTAFDTIRKLPAAAQPTNVQEERNCFLVHFSRAAGHNLCAYFETWGIEVTDASRTELAALPVWTPEEVASE